MRLHRGAARGRRFRERVLRERMYRDSRAPRLVDGRAPLGVSEVPSPHALVVEVLQLGDDRPHYY